MNRPRGPEEHKAWKRVLGVKKVNDLLAQSTKTDPYYVGRPAQWEHAEWFVDLLDTVGYADTFDLHNRRIHYRADALADEHGIMRPRQPVRYRNDYLSWRDLCWAASFARILRLIDPERFIDRRNPSAVLNRVARGEPPEPWWMLDVDEDHELSLARLPTIYSYPVGDLTAARYRLPRLLVDGYDYVGDDQHVLLELWVEKTTMNDILIPIAERLGANYVPASGVQSMTNAIKLLRRIERYDRPAVILYISDHDRQGQMMPVSVARDLEFWGEQLGITPDVVLDPIVLTAEQIEQYDLPVEPEGNKTELDALEALHPGELARIVEEAAEQYVDHDLPDRLADAEAEAERAVDEQWDEYTDELRAVVDRIVIDAKQTATPFRERFAEIERQREALAADVEQAMAPYREYIAWLTDEADELVDGFEPRLPERPESDQLFWPPPDVLYDSRRRWLEQLNAYRTFRGDAPLDLTSGDA